MELLAFIFRSSRPLVIATVLASIVTGALGAAIIAVINASLEKAGDSRWTMLFLFVAVVLAKTATQFASQIMLVRFTQESLLKLCLNLCEKVLGTPFEKLERLGSHRLLATLTEDVAVVSAAMQAVTVLATNGAVLLGCAAYLAWLSWELLIGSVALVIMGAIGYRLLHVRAFVAIQAARDGRDQLVRNLRTLIDGMKELKLSRARRDSFLREELSASADEVRKQNVTATRLYLVTESWNQLLFYGLVAGLLFLAPAAKEMSTATLTGYVFACLYMMTPIWTLVGTVPTFMRGRVSLGRIKDLGADLQFMEAEGASPATLRGKQLQISFIAVSYVYPHAPGEDRSFEFGPIDLALSGGEIIFVTGGNGSGKSTLVKLLTGLYTPTSGVIRIGVEPVEPANRDWYREHFATVFADFHLFDRLYGLETKGREDEIEKLLRMLQINHKVRVENGRFSTTALSSGQRRRVALLAAYLEDKPVYVFDEWAADQDPTYKAVFYTQVLPELRSRGKCVVVVTHDDRYFGCGDRVLALEGGRLIGGDQGLRGTPAGFLAGRISS